MAVTLEMLRVSTGVTLHPNIVQERLGYSSIQITLDTYSHVAPGLQEAAAVRFDEILLTKHESLV